MIGEKWHHTRRSRQGSAMRVIPKDRSAYMAGPVLPWVFQPYMRRCEGYEQARNAKQCREPKPNPRLGVTHRAKTFTTPSPPADTTRRPSWLQTTLHTPSPRRTRCAVISWVQMRLSRDQKRIEASCPAETASRPSLLIDRDEMADGWASMLYVHWPGSS